MTNILKKVKHIFQEQKKNLMGYSIKSSKKKNSENEIHHEKWFVLTMSWYQIHKLCMQRFKASNTVHSSNSNPKAYSNFQHSVIMHAYASNEIFKSESYHR